MTLKKSNLLGLVVILMTLQLQSQQVADTTYLPDIQSTAYDIGKGPIVFIDEGHYNFHTRTGRYTAFSKLLERDGYRGRSYTGAFNKKELSKGSILVISNALNKINQEDWFLPTPSRTHRVA